MKPSLVILAKVVIYLIGIAVIAVCAILLPELAREEAVGKVDPAPAYPFLIGAWVLALPIFTALYQALKLVNYLAHNNAFSTLSVRALRNIKYCSIAFLALISISIITVLILVRALDPSEDLAPLFTLGFVVTFAATVAATIISVLERVLQSAIAIKAENDLIV